MRDVDLTSKDIAALGSTTELMNREWAPCRHACPVHADVRGYLEHMAQGQWREAIDVIREALPFAGVCGRVCHHPCEANCRRADVDKAVAIREIKRRVAETQGAAGATVHKAARQDRAKVAVVGAGPAGMSAALELARQGYRPTVFEKFPIAGGIPVLSIPKYRLPREVMQMDIDWILAHGVELVTDVEVGKTKSIDQLRQEGFAAILVAAGLAASRGLPIPGADHKNVWLVLDFLRELAFDRKPAIGQDVLVIGGGNVAIDASRSAVRLGARRVRNICLENEQEMPAWPWEQDEAREEGVTFIHRRGPLAVVVKDGKIAGLKTRKVTRVFDENKRFSPAYDDADVQDIECDTIIFAIGQMADYGFTAGSGLKLDERKRLTFNAATHQTNVPDVFACGEIVTPPGSVVEACASGLRAAKAVGMFLSSRPIVLDDALPPKIDKIRPIVAEKVLKVARNPVPTESPDVRRATFAQTDHMFSEPAVMAEARRCMSCGAGAEVLADKCAACQTCVRVCPFGIPKVTDVARIESQLCQACGICMAECPANAIVPRGHDVADLTRRIDAALAGGKKVVAFVGGFHAGAAQWQGVSPLDGVAEIYLPSTSVLGVKDMLHALEAGASGVIVVSCGAGLDRYPQAAGRTKARVAQAQQLLKDIGFSPDRLQLLEVAAQARPAAAAAIVEAAAKIGPVV